MYKVVVAFGTDSLAFPWLEGCWWRACCPRLGQHLRVSQPAQQEAGLGKCSKMLYLCMLCLFMLNMYDYPNIWALALAALARLVRSIRSCLRLCVVACSWWTSLPGRWRLATTAPLMQRWWIISLPTTTSPEGRLSVRKQLEQAPSIKLPPVHKNTERQQVLIVPQLGGIDYGR